MASCSIQLRLDAYHDGELSAAERDTVAVHLATCPVCAAELAAIAGQSRQIVSAALPGLSQIARYRLHASIDRSIALASEQGMVRMARVLASVAACVLVTGSVWLSVGPEHAGPKAAPPWTGVATNAESEAVASDITTPAAQWYLADASKSSDEIP